jgi:hypothetical protein
MLTIKHIARTGHERTASADDVYFDPATGENGEYPKGQVVAYGMPRSDAVSHFSDGIVYVMNDNGSTVAKYNLN